MSTVAVLVLAAGQGTRMRSDRPKVLHDLAGVPILSHVLNAARGLHPDRIFVVTGHGADRVESALSAPDISWIRQPQQKGTGHAVSCALPALVGFSGDLLILIGDMPLIQTAIIQDFLDHHRREGMPLSVMTTTIDPPVGYGRMVRDATNRLVRIVEEKDADETIRKITEVNSGIYCASMQRLPSWLGQITNNNAQEEYYLTDMVPFAIREGGVATFHHSDAHSLAGINDRTQLAMAEATFRDRLCQKLMLEGVTFKDPSSCWLAADVKIGRDTIIEPNVILGPKTVMGERCWVGPFCTIQNSTLGPETRIEAFCHLDGAQMAGPNVVGPYARLRVGADLAPHAKVGNFCELKKTRLGQGSKINHLAYIGDAQIGANVNVGAGTITCNYDGVNKHRTILEDGVFIGSDTQLVAPVTVGKNAVVAAGTTVTKEVPPDSLAISRVTQKHVLNWSSRKKKT